MKYNSATMKNLLPLLSALIIFSACSKDSGSENVSYTVVINCNPSYGQNEAATVTLSIFPDVQNAMLSSAELHLDDKLISSAFSAPFTFTPVFTDLSPGNHELTATVKFSDGKSIKDTKNIVFKVSLGDEYKGGVVIKIAQDGFGGVIASKTDLQGGTLNRFKYGAYNGGYNAFSMDDGLSNTNQFIGKFDSDYAAIACLKSEYNGYDDWYLPAYNELALFEDYLSKLNIPERSGYIYWSSTGNSNNLQQAYAYAFGVSFGTPCDMQGLYRVRPCRRF